MIASFRTVRRVQVLAGAFAVLSLGALAPAAAAATPIGPNQIFIGQVNGSSSMSNPVKFDVVCAGAAKTGHAFGDTVGVVKLQDPIPGFGRTGNATSIAANLVYTKGTITVTEHITTFTTYTTKKVPTTVVTPCSGAGSVAFDPVHGGSTSTPSTVPVTFINLGTRG